MPRLLVSPTAFRALKRQPLIRHINYHPEPRAFQASRHASHRALYRWTAQAFATPFLVAYLCEKLSKRSESGGSSWKLDLPKIEAGLLTEPSKMNARLGVRCEGSGLKKKYGVGDFDSMVLSVTATGLGSEHEIGFL